MIQDSDSLTELISQFEASALSLQAKKGAGGSGKPPRLLPTPLQLYQVGKLLYDTEERASEAHFSILKAYQALLEQLPVSYLRDVLFHDLNTSFSLNHDSIDAVHSICGLYFETPLACQTGFSVNLCKSVCSAYSIVKQERNHDRECTSLLRTLSSLVVESLNHDGSTDGDQEEQLQSIMQVIQDLTEDAHNTCFGDMVKWQEQTIPTKSISVVIKSKFEETPQREYLLLMLSSSPTSPSYQSTQNHVQQQKQQEYAAVKTVSTASEIQRRTQLVKDVLPLGEGFIEAALSLFQGDVDRTVAALLESQTDPTSLPPALQMLDRKLPKRLAETTPDSYSLNDEEARRITKARLADMESKQEAEAFVLGVVGNTNDEYDDDYDDQYDGLDGGEDLGGMDGNTYDVDLDAIRTYNRAAMAAEAEGAFWVSNTCVCRNARFCSCRECLQCTLYFCLVVFAGGEPQSQSSKATAPEETNRCRYKDVSWSRQRQRRPTYWTRRSISSNQKGWQERKGKSRGAAK